MEQNIEKKYVKMTQKIILHAIWSHCVNFMNIELP
jgi:hypothetical protein